jgi:histone H3/H4
MRRLIKEIVDENAPALRISHEAVAALHLAAEPLLTHWFEML